MRRIRDGLTYANVMSSLAVFMVLGGSAYAAARLPRNSVGATQIKTNAVTSSKVRNGSLLSKDFKAGQLKAGPAGATGAAGPAGPAGAKGEKGDKGDKGDPGPLLDTLPSGRTETGTFGAGVTTSAAGQKLETSISFALPLASPPAVTIVPKGGTPPAQCPGSVAEPAATPGNLCVFVRVQNGSTGVFFYGADDQGNPKRGIVVFTNSTAGPTTTELAGTYAVTAA